MCDFVVDGKICGHKTLQKSNMQRHIKIQYVGLASFQGPKLIFYFLLVTMRGCSLAGAMVVRRLSPIAPDRYSTKECGTRSRSQNAALLQSPLRQ